ncbi:hypothetical protein WMF45_44940 [Sorangium sp. So ce448]|uniref:hypothetical protein n=1 Tax=Sorangium sp. So ce448 TaxID=3133314 RepID=UPI003F628AC9
MTRFKVKRAESPGELRAHLRKRWVIFMKQAGYSQAVDPPSSMEFDRFDACPATAHFNILIEDEGEDA